MASESLPDARAKFYLTTPIYYVNARPHIGHAYSTIVADVLARRHRLLGDDTFFLTGTDEHGQKIERSAAAEGMPPQEFADRVSKTFSDLWKRMGITNDAFIRTTDERHKRGVQQLFERLYELGHIYLSTYTGQYSIGEEMFVDGPPGTIGPDGRPTETVTEENFFFRLSAFQEKLIELIESDTLRLTPESSKNEVLSFVRGGLKDLSVSRSSFTWGIPVPEEVQREAGATQKHVVYVWLDALANYMTAVGYGNPSKTAEFAKWWPADLHLVGKEITRFHCVYWPAFLLALDPARRFVGDEREEQMQTQIPFGNDNQKSKGGDQSTSGPANSDWVKRWLPRQVTANGWLLFDNSKMSKSKGNVVRTETILDGFGDHVYGKQFPESSKPERDLFASDVLRYFLLREIPFGQDGSFSFEAMVTRYNADLTNGYGNLVSRTLNLLSQNFGSSHAEAKASDYAQMSPFTEDEETALQWDHAKKFSSVIPSQASKLVESFSGAPSTTFHNDLQRIVEFLQTVDRFVSDEQPWKIARRIREEQEKVFPHETPEQTAERIGVLVRRLACVLYTSAEAIRIATVLLSPILPYSTARVIEQLGIEQLNAESRSLQWGALRFNTMFRRPTHIFPKADDSLATLMEEFETPSETKHRSGRESQYADARHQSRSRCTKHAPCCAFEGSEYAYAWAGGGGGFDASGCSAADFVA